MLLQDLSRYLDQGQSPEILHHKLITKSIRDVTTSLIMDFSSRT